MNKIIDTWQALVDRLEGLGAWLAPLGLRLLLAWEFWEAGREKFSGSNWFMDIPGRVPFPPPLASEQPARNEATRRSWKERDMTVRGRCRTKP